MTLVLGGIGPASSGMIWCVSGRGRSRSRNRALSGGEPRRPDPAFAAVGPRADTSRCRRRRNSLMRPGLRPSALGQSVHRVPRGGGFQRPGQEHAISPGGVAAWWWPSRHRLSRPERGVVVGQGTDLHVGVGRAMSRSAAADATAAPRPRAPGRGSSMLGPDPSMVGRHPAVADRPDPVQVGADLDVRQPITTGSTEKSLPSGG